MYAADFVKVDYSKPHQDWKREYYKFYMGVDPDEEKDYEGYTFIL